MGRRLEKAAAPPGRGPVFQRRGVGLCPRLLPSGRMCPGWDHPGGGYRAALSRNLAVNSSGLRLHCRGGQTRTAAALLHVPLHVLHVSAVTGDGTQLPAGPRVPSEGRGPPRARAWCAGRAWPPCACAAGLALEGEGGEMGVYVQFSDFMVKYKSSNPPQPSACSACVLGGRRCSGVS